MVVQTPELPHSTEPTSDETTIEAEKNREISDLLASKIANINNDRAFIEDCIMSKGDQLARTWHKRAELRDEILRSLGDDYDFEVPMIAIGPLYSLGNYENLPTLTISHKRALLIPYFNRPSLLGDPSRLLRLLYHRAFNNPPAWIPYEDTYLDAFIQHGFFNDPYSEGCVSLHFTAFGKWAQLDVEAIERGSTYPTTRAMLGLESQQLLLLLLRTICERLLELLAA